MASISSSNRSNPSETNAAAVIRPSAGRPGAVVFIDSEVSRPEILIDAALTQTATRLVAEHEDGLAVIGGWLRHHGPASAVHVLAHGSPGAFRLGRTLVSAETLLERSAEIRAWGAWLGDDAELLLYGCELAKGRQGRALCDRLQELTGARVAASTTRIGHSDLGGNWELDWAPAPMRSPLAVSAAVQASYPGVLEDAIYGEERVNTYTPNYQYSPSISFLADGSYVVVWTSREQDGSNDGVYAQRFSASGVPQGPEFRVNTTTGNHQLDPEVTALSDGGFVVVWTDQGGADGSGYGVYGQRYNAAGVAQDSEFRVNTYTSSTQYQPSVAAHDGGFVVIWTSYGNTGDTSSYGVYTQRYTNAGATVGTETRVNTTTSDQQYEPSVAARADGSYVVVWRSDNQDGSGAGVYFQRYDTNGATQGSETRANTTVASDQYEPRLAMLSDGGFVIVWTSYGQDGSGEGIYAQRYDSAGVVQGGEFKVNTYTGSTQYQPSVAAYDGGFVVTWTSYGNDGSSYGVYSQSYTNAGATVGAETRVNTTTANHQYESDVAARPTAATPSSGGRTTRTTAPTAASTSSCSAPLPISRGRRTRRWATSPAR